MPTLNLTTVTLVARKKETDHTKIYIIILKTFNKVLGERRGGGGRVLSVSEHPNGALIPTQK